MIPWCTKLLAVLRYFGGALLIWVLRPRSLALLTLMGGLCVVVAVSYHYIGAPLFILMYRKVLEEGARLMSLIERELLLMAPTMSALIAKLTAKAWAKRVVVVVGGWMLTRRLRTWLVELRVVVLALLKHQFLQRPLLWWQGRTRLVQVIVIGITASVVVSFVGLHVLGLLIIITFDVLRTLWRALLGPILWIGARVGGSKLAEWFHFSIIPAFVRMVLGRWGTLPTVVMVRSMVVRGRWRVLRILVPLRVKVRAQARELVDEHFARMAARRAARRIARGQGEPDP